MNVFSRWIATVFASTLLLGIAGWAQAQYPNKPIRFIVPWPPGGGADTVGRPIAQKLSEALGQPVVVENIPGAGGSVGAGTAARAAPDGYTVLMNYVSDAAINATLYGNLNHDPAKDLAPVTQIAGGNQVLVVHPDVPARSVQELIALAKSKPGQLSYSSAGYGSMGHLAAEMFKSMSGVNIVHVPYKGSAPSIMDLLGGRVSMTFADITVVVPHIKAGKLVPLAVTSSRRSLILPELPTVSEAGVSGFHATGWWGIAVPAGTPPQVIQRLNTELVAILRTPEMNERISKLGAAVVASSPEEFRSFIRAESAKWASLIKTANIKVE